MTIQQAYVRRMTKENRYYFSGHALQRIGERMISTEQVLTTILQGNELEVQKTGPNEDVRVLFQESTDKFPEFYVVVATSYPNVAILSVIPFKEEAWEFVGKVARRIKNS